MNDIFLAELKRKFQINNISDEEFSISMEIEIPKFSNENVVVLFDDFEIDNQRNQQFILDSMDFVVNNFYLMQVDVFESISNYLHQQFSIAKSNEVFSRFDVSLTTIAFMPAISFGTFKLFFHSIYEEEHGLGVLIEKLSVIGVGYGDIRFPKRK